MGSNKYGKRVIGEEEAAKQAVARKRKANKYGKRVVTPIEDVAAEAAPTQPSRANEQSRILTVPPAQVPETDEPAKEPETVEPQTTTPPSTTDNVPLAMGIKELSEALDGNPGLLDELLVTELDRPDIRLGALRKFREVEGLRADGPRADVLAMIDEAITKKTTAN